jgi:hypothetical protein
MGSLFPTLLLLPVSGYESPGLVLYPPLKLVQADHHNHALAGQLDQTDRTPIDRYVIKRAAYRFSCRISSIWAAMLLDAPGRDCTSTCSGRAGTDRVQVGPLQPAPWHAGSLLKYRNWMCTGRRLDNCTLQIL